MEHRLFDLTGMTALVTGAAGGIGSAISHALARQGARLALSGTNPAKLRAFREELNDTYGHDHVEITCDLSNSEQVEHLVPAGELDPDQIHTPGIFVKRIVAVDPKLKHIEQRTVRQRV